MKKEKMCGNFKGIKNCVIYTSRGSKKPFLVHFYEDKFLAFHKRLQKDKSLMKYEYQKSLFTLGAILAFCSLMIFNKTARLMFCDLWQLKKKFFAPT